MEHPKIVFISTIKAAWCVYIPCDEQTDTTHEPNTQASFLMYGHWRELLPTSIVNHQSKQGTRKNGRRGPRSSSDIIILL